MVIDKAKNILIADYAKEALRTVSIKSLQTSICFSEYLLKVNGSRAVCKLLVKVNTCIQTSFFGGDRSSSGL